MFYPYSQYYDFTIAAREEAVSYIRLLHAAPGAPNVDVYANQNLIARNLGYRGFTPYLKVAPGTYNVRVFPAGQTANPVITRDITLNASEIYTAAAIGTVPNLDILVVPDVRVPFMPGRANVRFVHLSPNAPAVDVYTPDGTVLFRNVAYRQISNYIPVVPGRHTIYVRPTGTANPVLYVPNIVLEAQKNYTIYAIGLVGGTPGLQVLIPLDGSTYIR